MADVIKIDFRLPDFRRLSQQARTVLPQVLAATMQTQRALIFDSSGSYNGRAGWAPLKFRDGMPLKDTGTLSKSMGPQNDGVIPSRVVGGSVTIEGDTVTIGTTLAYARLMNDGTAKMPGGVLRASGGALRIPLPGGKRASPAAKQASKAFKGVGQAALYVKSVRIPPRPFDDWTSDDTAEIAGTLQNYVASMINAQKAGESFVSRVRAFFRS